MSSCGTSLKYDAGFEHAAVHEPCRHRRELSGNDRQHCLIEQREPGDDLALIDERATFDVAGHRNEVRIAKPFADRGGRCGAQLRRRRVPVLEDSLGAGQEQVALLDAIEVLDQSLAACNPGVRLRELAAKQER